MMRRFLLLSLALLLASGWAGARKTQTRCLYRQGGIVQGDPSRRRVCLIFTADAWADGAEAVINTLREKNVQAGFFLTGRFYEQYPAVVRRLVSEGHYVGSHGYAHLLYFPWGGGPMAVSEKEFRADMQRSYALMRRFGIRKRQAPYFIPSYEHYNDTVSQWARRMGLQVLSYTAGSGSNADYTIPSMQNYRSSDSLQRCILRYEAEYSLAGHFMLLHLGTHPERTDKFYHRLPWLIDELRSRGYQLVGVRQMIEE